MGKTRSRTLVGGQTWVLIEISGGATGQTGQDSLLCLHNTERDYNSGGGGCYEVSRRSDVVAGQGVVRRSPSSSTTHWEKLGKITTLYLY